MICECKYCGDVTEIGEDWELDPLYLVKYGKNHFCGHGKGISGILNIVTTGEKLRAIFCGHK